MDRPLDVPLDFTTKTWPIYSKLSAIKVKLLSNKSRIFSSWLDREKIKLSTNYSLKDYLYLWTNHPSEDGSQLSTLTRANITNNPKYTIPQSKKRNMNLETMMINASLLQEEKQHIKPELAQLNLPKLIDCILSKEVQCKCQGLWDNNAQKKWIEMSQLLLTFLLGNKN